ncbi:MAG: hypothetical protein FWD06_00040 [Oscillospiraceae bacterium]|nr:hypothetical protein [Oscillospiraceae bacterium]
MTTNSTWTTVNGMVMPGSGTQTFGGNCMQNPFGLPGMVPGFDGWFGGQGFNNGGGMQPNCFGNMWSMPCCCMQGMPTYTAGNQGSPFGM